MVAAWVPRQVSGYLIPLPVLGEFLFLNLLNGKFQTSSVDICFVFTKFCMTVKPHGYYLDGGSCYTWTTYD